uniref:Cysteine-rich receptor-like protein kinase 2 n=1 Tax=Populus alba TaxID=43335 RepID=A0A4U5MCB7_POPAL|nr:cysteine-rich receptor-like protein kinase 2 [Populus alba]
MTKANQSIPYQRMFFCFFGYVLLRERVVVGDPRSQTVQVMCGRQLEHNATIFVPNFVATMENISEQMRVSGFGVAVSGSGPDINYGLAQCYGDLSLLDCVLCYAEARTILPQCYPYNGGRIYLDGCFMRAENYSFYEEYLGPGDKAVCGNTTRKNSTFAESTKQAVSQAVTRASNNQGYARVQLPVPGTNESAYVLANCWETLNASSCRACLENATASILGCLPWSEGRALYTGCFMRYSDIDFLNDERGNGGSRGSIVIIVVSVISSLVVLGLGVSIGVYIWKRRYIMKKRRGSNEAQKLARTLNDSSLNFKQNNRSKASEYTESLVILTWKKFQAGTVEELYDPNLMLHNHHDNNVKNDVKRAVHVGLLCTQEIPSLRPSMSKALQMLTTEEHLPRPSNPPFIDEMTMELKDTCEDPCYPLNYGTSASIATIENSSFRPR